MDRTTTGSTRKHAYTRRRWLGSAAATACCMLCGQLPMMQFAAGSAHASDSIEKRRSFGRARHCILLWMTGGPPQHETWDPKPLAPAEIRGPYRPIDSSLPGVRVCELMPRVARLVDQLCVLRGMHTDNPSHPSSSYEMLTGAQHRSGKGRDDIEASPSDWPSIAAVVNRFRSPSAGLPASVIVPQPIFNVPFYPGQDAGFLGRKWDPWRLECDPSQADFRIPEFTLTEGLSPDRLVRRHSLVGALDSGFAATKGSDDYGRFIDQAFDVLGGNRAREAFDLTRELDSVRDRYGRHKFGQGCLLARRLVEAGVSLVQVNWHRDANDDVPMWDVHWDMQNNLERELMPPMDEGYSALIEDLQQRGLLEDTLVAWVGEFGRTPKMEYVKPHPAIGRNHWGGVFSAALAGGGVRSGIVHGASDKDGAYPADGAIGPSDWSATLFHLLGLAPDTEIRDTLSRPHPISRGRVIHEILA